MGVKFNNIIELANKRQLLGELSPIVSKDFITNDLFLARNNKIIELYCAKQTTFKINMTEKVCDKDSTMSFNATGFNL